MVQDAESPRSSSYAAPIRVRLGLSARVLLAVLAALALSGAIGTGLTLWQDRRSVKLELETSMDAAEHVARAEAGRGQSLGETRVAALFSGSRHVKVTVLDATGRTKAVSRLFLEDAQPPDWFAQLFDPHLSTVRVAMAGGETAVLEPFADNEIGEAWVSDRDALIIGLLFAAATIALTHVTVSRALRPLSKVSAALRQVEAGRFGRRVEPEGPPEARALASGFNAMADRLALADDDNRRLQAELLRLQEEERAEFARDLHDEIGPYLFAIGIDAAAVRDTARAKGQKDVAERAALIGAAVTHMQGRVREMLARLRPLRAVELGLGRALADLVDFWRLRCANILFDLTVALGDETDVSQPARGALYRVTQEAVTNAVRHGAPSRIDIRLERLGEIARLTVSDDGVGRRGAARPGFGLQGMRERVEALSGELLLESRGEGRGWTVTACLPIEAAAAANLEPV